MSYREGLERVSSLVFITERGGGPTAYWLPLLSSYSTQQLYFVPFKSTGKRKKNSELSSCAPSHFRNVLWGKIADVPMVFTRCVIRRWDMITLRVSAARMLLILFGDILGGSRSLFLRFSCKRFPKTQRKLMIGSCDELFSLWVEGWSCHVRVQRGTTQRKVFAPLL